MAKARVDITGKVYGNWTVIQDGLTDTPLCRCSCGVVKRVRRYTIMSGMSKSCGCGGKGQRGTEDLTGKKFGSWTVVANGHEQKVTCMCECGTKKEVDRYSLISGASKSCGCRVKKDYCKINTGDRFGSWVVIGPGKDYIHVRCKCICGFEKDVIRYSLVNGNSKGCGESKCKNRGAQKTDSSAEDIERIRWTLDTSLISYKPPKVDTEEKSKLTEEEIARIRAPLDTSLLRYNPAVDVAAIGTDARISIGAKFGDWTIIGGGSDGAHVTCRCVCGAEREVRKWDLIYGKSKSCGCRQRNGTYSASVGDKFFDWTVIGPGQRKRHVMCRCICGTEREVFVGNLVYGISRGCGCKSKVKDMTGERFGSLTVLYHTSSGKVMCKCECGNIKEYYISNLRRGDTNSCGCRNTQKLIDLTGKRFGLLTVVRYLGRQTWECKCDCGGRKEVSGWDLRAGHTRSCGCLKEEYRSLMEIEWTKYIEQTYGIKLNSRNNRAIPGMELDIFDTNRKIAIEVNGGYWHNAGFKGKSYHLDKTRACFNSGIRLVHLWEHENNRKEAIKNLMNILFGGTDVSVSKQEIEVQLCDKADIQSIIDTYYLGNDIDMSENVNIAVKVGGKIVGAAVAQSTPEMKVAIHGFCYDSYSVCGRKALRRVVDLLKKEYPAYDIEVAVDISKFTGQSYIDLGFKATRLSEPREIVSKVGSKEFILMDSGRMICTLSARRTDKSEGIHIESIKMDNQKLDKAVEIDFGTLSADDMIQWKSRFDKEVCTTLYDRKNDILVTYHPVDEHTKRIDRSHEVARYVNGTERKPIHIFEYELADGRKRNIICSIIKRKITSKKVLWARDTEIQRGDSGECKKFIDKYHLSGGLSKACTYYKCVDTQGNILGVMQVGENRFNQDKGILEIIRLAWRPDVAVTGGTEKLFKHMIRELKPRSVLAYSEVAKFDGNVYERIGMTRCSEVTTPGYHWYNGEQALSRYQCQKHRLLEKGLGDEYMTEVEIMESLGYWRVYDYGNWRFVWEAPKTE